MAKIQIFLVLLCLAQVSLSARIVREAEVESSTTTETAIKPKCAANVSNSSEEFTMKDVSELKTELLAEQMPEKQANILTHVFSKMTADKTDSEKLDGFMKVMTLLIAINQNRSEDALLKLVESFDSSEEENKVRPRLVFGDTDPYGRG